MAPKINPNPQLKRLTKTVSSVTIAAALAVLLQCLTSKLINELIGLVRANA